MGATLAIVGRPNVGKSTLFNRLIGERKSIIDDFSGVTRDRLYGKSFWNGKNFSVIDTGGFVKNSDDIFEAAIREQVLIAMEEADVILFMTDVTTGITDYDEEIARMLRRTKKPVLLAVNKVDNQSRHLSANEFWSLGFENTHFLSSITGSGSGDLLDAVVEAIPADLFAEEEESDTPKIAIVGRPNVGKSSLVNALLDESRNVVTDIAGTTRDSIHTTYEKFGMEFVLIDTAGIRKKKKVHEDLEFYSVIRAVKSIEESDITFLLIDATLGIEKQDLNIFGLIQKRSKGIVILVNKWDLLQKETNSAKEYTQKIKASIAPFSDVPIVFISVLEKQRIFKAMETAKMVYENRKRKIKTSELNEFLQDALMRTPPPMHRGREIKIKYVTQLKMAYPAFAFFCNHPGHVKDSYKNFLENQLRDKFDFTGVPIKVYFRSK